MIDMTKTILAKSDQLNADDLAAPMTVKITDVKMADSADQPITIRFEGDQGKPFKPCKTVRRVLVRAWGPDGGQYVGRLMTLYNEPTVKWGGQPVGGIRISHLSHIEQDLQIPVTITRGVKKPVIIKRLDMQDPPPPKTTGGADWQSVEVDEIEIAAKLESAAMGGMHNFTETWKTMWKKYGPTETGNDLKEITPGREIMNSHKDTLKALAEDNTDEFGLGPLNGEG